VVRVTESRRQCYLSIAHAAIYSFRRKFVYLVPFSSYTSSELFVESRKSWPLIDDAGYLLSRGRFTNDLRTN